MLFRSLFLSLAAFYLPHFIFGVPYSAELIFFADSMRLALALMVLVRLSRQEIYADALKLLFGFALLSFYFAYFAEMLPAYSHRNLRAELLLPLLMLIANFSPLLLLRTSKKTAVVLVCALSILFAALNTSSCMRVSHADETKKARGVSE